MKLFEFAYCGNYNSKISALSRLSPEQWSFRDKKDNGILKNYIEHTFRRVHHENKIIIKEDHAIFNTGLFDMYYKSIYAYFVKNKAPGSQKWYLNGFLTEYQLTTMGITDIPERASYFDNPEDLVFDTRLKIVPQYDHIFGDENNLKRLPEAIRINTMKVQLFDGAIETTKRMLDSNYKIAVPQFYNEKMQLLVPICLQNPNVPDLALTCMKTDDKTKYISSTCLTLEMAYNNARLIAKPESNWLKA